MATKPNVNSAGEKELVAVEEQFKAHKEQIDTLTHDRMNLAPKLEVEPQTKLSQQEIAKKPDIYLKPHRAIASQEKFNEVHRENYNYDKEYVHFVAENKEIIGEDIDIWTKPYPGLPAEWWKVPVNKPVWGPRYLAERLRGCNYHRLTMDQGVQTGATSAGNFYGQLVVDNTIQRLDAMPVSSKRSIFMGAANF